MDNLQHEGAFNLSEVIEWDVARQMYPDAIVVGSRMTRCEKSAELMLPEELKIYKGRLLAQGNHIVHSSGVKIYGPQNMNELQSARACGVFVEDEVLFQGWVGSVASSLMSSRERAASVR